MTAAGESFFRKFEQLIDSGVSNVAVLRAEILDVDGVTAGP